MALFESLTYPWSKPLLSFCPSCCATGFCMISSCVFRAKCRRAGYTQCWCSLPSKGQSQPLLPNPSPSTPLLLRSTTMLASVSIQLCCFLLRWRSVSEEICLRIASCSVKTSRHMPNCVANPPVTQQCCKPFKQVRMQKILVSKLELNVEKLMGMSLKHKGKGKNIYFTAVDYISQISGRNSSTGLVKKSCLLQ